MQQKIPNLSIGTQSSIFFYFRRIVGMVKSPVEGNDIVILKLEDPVVFSGIWLYFNFTLKILE